MERVRFIFHQGQRILLIDYSELTDERQILDIIAERKEIVAEQPLNSLLTLTDVTNARYNHAAIEAIKVAAVLDRPHLKRAAAVGLDTMYPRGAIEAISTFSTRHWARFHNREEALEWLISDAEAVSA